MAERTRQAKSRQRGAAKESSKATEPSEQLDDATESNSTGGKSDAIAAAKSAAGAAAAAALAGALVGAGKALLQRRSQADDGSEADEVPESEGPDEPTQSAAAQPVQDDESADADETERDVQQPDASATDDSDEDDEDTDASESEPEDVSRAAPVDSESESEPERDVGRNRPRQPEHGAPSSDVAKIIGNARSYVQDFLGKEPESVSGVDRSNGSWSVTVEVVELERVPDTTDVLGSYEVVLDEDGNLVRLERTRRYLRSQVEELS